jgi:hypothetical protein
MRTIIVGALRSASRSLGAAARLVVLCLALCPAGWSAAAFAQVADPSLWSTDGPVESTVRDGNTIYIGGSFLKVGPSSGGGVEVDAVTGKPRAAFPKVAGVIEVVVPDGHGGWFIGGDFSGVAGLPHHNLAHLLPNGAVAAWNPEPDGPVAALALSDGTLYLGGAFGTIGGQTRHLAAAVDVRTGVVRPWDPDVHADEVAGYNRVWAILVAGDVVYMGGAFTTVGGQRRYCLAALDATTGKPTAWNPSPDSDVRTLALKDSTLYVGGGFWNIGGRTRKVLAAVDRTTGEARSWDAGVDQVPENVYQGGRRVMGLIVSDTTLYVAGIFNRIGGATRQGLAAVSTATGAATSWDPHAVIADWLPASFYGLARLGRTLYVGGWFDSLGGRSATQSGGMTGAIDMETGLAVDWNPRPNNVVSALAAAGGAVYLGGHFSSVWNWQPRVGLAALDATTGALKPWNPGADNLVKSLAVRGGKVYAGGWFSTMGGRPRRGLAAIDAQSGAVTDWDPGCNGPIWTIALGESTLYAGGWFESVGGQPRRDLAEVDTLTGAVTAWDPHPDNIVFALARQGSIVYVGGDFTNIGGAARLYVAALDATSGAATTWKPDANSDVECIAVKDTTAYVGGRFTHIGGQARVGIAAVSTITGVATEWKADVNEWEPGVVSAPVTAIAIGEGVVYAGGFFTSIGGQPRPCIAALDAATGALRDWNPDLDDTLTPDPPYVYSLSVSENTVYAGGYFTSAGPTPVSGFAALSAVPRPFPAGWSHTPSLALAQSAPNPVQGLAVIRFRLRDVSVVSLKVFDLQGRLAAALLRDQPLAAGQHEVSLSTAGWRPGCYVYRLEAAGSSVVRKMVVVK